jgi:hypothetical protein
MTTPSSFLSLERQNPWLTFFLTVITLGLYVPIWFLIQRKALNSLNEHQQLNITQLIVLLVLYSLDTIGFILIDLGEFFGVSQDASSTYNVTSSLLSWVQWVWVVILSFKVQDMLKDFVGTRYYKVGFVGFYTFFLSIYYLQYKVNQILEEEEHYVDIDNFGMDNNYREF